MVSVFDRLFGDLPQVMTRGDDGEPILDLHHPAVQRFLQAVKACKECGDSVDVIMEIVEGVFAEYTAKKLGDAKDGRLMD